MRTAILFGALAIAEAISKDYASEAMGYIYLWIMFAVIAMDIIYLFKSKSK